MQPIVILVALLAVAYLAVRAGTLALVRTGLSRESASFQAQSAFMGVGFTTSESEAVVSHPVRRRVVRMLMMAGYAGIAATVSAVVVGFQGKSDTNALGMFGLLFLCVGAVILMIKIPAVRQMLDAAIEPLLERIPALRVVDYEALLQLDDGYAITEVPFPKDHWGVGRSLRELRLADEGVLVLSVARSSGGHLGTPRAETSLHVGDRLLCYGRLEAIQRLRERRGDERGERERERAIVEQQAVSAEETVKAERLEDLADAEERAAEHRESNPDLDSSTS